MTSRLKLGSVVSVLLAAACLVPATATARGLGRCTLPVTHDPYEGFHVGVPNGWYLGRLNGMIVVSKDVSGSVEAVVEPVVLTHGLTVGRVFSSVYATLKQKIVAAGSSISYHVTSRRGGQIQAAVRGATGATSNTGQAGVAVLSHRTAHGSKLAVFYAFWAPSSQFRSERATLASIPACYGPQPGALLQVVRDQQFTYPLPSGWTPSEQFNVLGVTDGNVAGAYYFFLEAVTPSQGVTNAQTLLQYLFSNLRITDSNTLYTVTAPSTTSVTGATEEAERTEFTGALNGVGSLHGMATVNSSTGGGVTSGVVRLAISAPSLWNSLSGVLLEIAGGIQHSFVQDAQQIAQVSQQWQAFGQQVAGFDDALNSVDIVTDPLTGKDYMANYDAYQLGPNGPGYYLGDHKLKIITPS